MIFTAKKKDDTVPETESVQKNTEPTRYKKSAFLKSEKFRQHSYLLSLLLDDDKVYTISEVEQLLKRMKGKV